MPPIGFKDARLQARLEKLTERMGDAPNLSFPQMFEDPAELEACYRFFSNAKVTPELILAPHYVEVKEKASTLKDVLVIHDTTQFSFGEDNHRRGLGRVRKAKDTFFAHVSLVLSPQGYRRPLGVAALKTWVRADLADNEHARWINNAESSLEYVGRGNAIHIMDREGDDYELFFQLMAQNERFVIRSNHDRLLADRSGGRKLKELTLNLEREVERDVLISKRSAVGQLPIQKQRYPARASRIAGLTIGATTVKLKRPNLHPRDKDKPRPPGLPKLLQVNIVRVWEPEPPPGESPIEWRLITTEPSSTPEEIERIVDHYRARWTIEEYFKAIKTGCSMEKRQLLDYESLCNALATFIPVACRVLALRSDSRDMQEETRTLALEGDEVAMLRIKKPKMVSGTPTSRELLLAVASLGGHIKWNGDPGWLTLLRGMQKLLILTEGWRLAKLQYSRDQS